MEYVKLGGSGLLVSPLCLGTMMFGSAANEEESISITHRALDDGINFFDTANAYNNGLSEEILGKALEGRRNEAVLVTKVNASTGDGPNDGGLSRYHILNEVENSLRRLKTDHIDIYMLHRRDFTTPIEESLGAMNDLVRQGKVRYIGMSNHYSWQVRGALDQAKYEGISPVVCIQDLYNIVNRDLEVDMLPFCHEFGVGVMAYSPLARGILTGKYRLGKDVPINSRAGRGDRRILETELRDGSIKVAQELSELSEGMAKKLSQFALNWVISNPIVTSAIIGPRNLDQYEDNIGALGWEIESSILAKLDELVPPGEHTGYGFNDPQNPVRGRPSR